MALPTHSPIGPVTEARIQAAFAEAAVIGGEAAAALIGCSPKTLNELADAGAIRAVRKGGGSSRGYTEGDIRLYLTQSDAPSRGPRPRATAPGRPRVVPFSRRASAQR